MGHEKSQSSEYMAGVLPNMATISWRSKLTLCAVNDLSSPNTPGTVNFGIHKEACACRSNSTPTTSCCCIVSLISLGDQAPKSSAQLQLTMQVMSETQFAGMIFRAMTLKASISERHRMVESLVSVAACFCLPLQQACVGSSSVGKSLVSRSVILLHSQQSPAA